MILEDNTCTSLQRLLRKVWPLPQIQRPYWCQNITHLYLAEKTFLQLVLQEEYKSYNDALQISQLETLKKRRKELTLRLAQTSLANGLLHDLFQIRKKQHTMRTRNKGRYKVFHASTKHFRNSPILTMQRMLKKLKSKHKKWLWVTYNITVCSQL